jgi:hypothetical protein
VFVTLGWLIAGDESLPQIVFLLVAFITPPMLAFYSLLGRMKLGLLMAIIMLVLVAIYFLLFCGIVHS